MKICEYPYHGARVIEHKLEDVVSIRSTYYTEPKDFGDPSISFIGFEYPATKSMGSLVVHLKNGTTEVFPASNWQIEF